MDQFRAIGDAAIGSILFAGESRPPDPIQANRMNTIYFFSIRIDLSANMHLSDRQLWPIAIARFNYFTFAAD